MKNLEPLPLFVWQIPNANEEYVLAVDPQFNSDPTAIEVISRVTGKQCAEIVIKESPEVVADITLSLAVWFNGAQVAVETNGVGMIVNSLLREYENLYRWKRMDRLTGGLVEILGWWTDAKSIKVIESVLKEVIQSEPKVFNGKDLQREARDFTKRSIIGRRLTAFGIAQTVRYEGRKALKETA